MAVASPGVCLHSEGVGQLVRRRWPGDGSAGQWASWSMRRKLMGSVVPVDVQWEGSRRLEGHQLRTPGW